MCGSAGGFFENPDLTHLNGTRRRVQGVIDDCWVLRWCEDCTRSKVKKCSTNWCGSWGNGQVEGLVVYC